MLSRFWVTFIVAVSIGTLVGVNLTPDETQALDLFTWFYLAIISVGTDSVARNRTSCQISALLRTWAVGFTTINGVLYFLTTVGVSSIGSVPLTFWGQRFTGGSVNPHLIAMPLAMALYVQLSTAITTKEVMRKAVYLALGVVSYVVVLATVSSTALAAIWATAVTAPVLIFSASRRTRERRFVALTASFVVLILVFLLSWDRVSDFFVSFVESDPSGADRLDRWKGFTYILDTSPFVGLGPGVHAPLGGEFHNSYIEILAFSGVFGLVALVVFLVATIVRLSGFGLSVAIALPGMYFGIAGFSLRRLTFWVVLSLLLGAMQSPSETRPSHVKCSGDFLRLRHKVPRLDTARVTRDYAGQGATE